MQDSTRRTFRTRIGLALVALPLALALAAAPALAAAGPHLSLSPGRGASGTLVTMTLKNCSDPRLWLDPTINGSAAADAGAPGNVAWQTQRGPFIIGYQFAGTWAGSGTSWTASFTASFPPGKIAVLVWCTPYKVYVATFTAS